MFAAGCGGAAPLRSEGTAEACGWSCEDQCLPRLIAVATYTQFAAARGHAVLPRRAGTAEACGRSCEGQRDRPALIADGIYAQWPLEAALQPC